MKVIIKIYNKILDYSLLGVFHEIYFRIYLFFYIKFNQNFFSSNLVERSESDNGMYIALINKILKNKKYFKNFKRKPVYRQILEHVTYIQGYNYLEIIARDNSELINNINLYLENDNYGKPIRFYYSKIKKFISPTTLRYIKIVSDIKKFFGNNFHGNICEIGSGYGGQYLLLDKTFKIRNYTIIDLPEVNKLIEQYLTFFSIKSNYFTTTIEDCDDRDYDFFISNYSFSELPKKLQRICLKKIISKCKHGYMIMNSGKSNSVYQNHISLNEIKDYLPGLKTIAEEPLTHEGNYTIIW